MIARRLLLLFLTALALPGCASWFLHGASIHEAGAPATYEGRWHAPTCRLHATDAEIPGPVSLVWYLVEGQKGPVLLELDARGHGSAIHNGWRDEKAAYYFVYVGSQGWVYAMPDDERLQPVRYVYTGPSFRVTERDGVLMPLGEPVASCPMVSR